MKKLALGILALAALPAFAKKKAPAPAPAPTKEAIVAIAVPSDWNIRSTADIARIKAVDPVMSNQLRLGLGYGLNNGLALESYKGISKFESSTIPSVDLAWRSPRLAKLGRVNLHGRIGLGLEPLRRSDIVDYPAYSRSESQLSMNLPATAALEAQFSASTNLQLFMGLGGGLLTAMTTKSALGPEKNYRGGRLLADIGGDWKASWMPRATTLSFGLGGAFDRVAGQSMSELNIRTGFSVYL